MEVEVAAEAEVDSLVVAAGSLAAVEALAAVEPEGAGNIMHPELFLSRLQHNEIVEAIHRAEQSSTGKIHVFVSHQIVGDALTAARQRFETMKMHETHHHNGILIFVAPRSQSFAVVGDQAVHDRVGDAAWNQIASSMAHHFRDNQYTRGIVSAIQQLGDLLAAHFPRQAGANQNPL